ncbi:MAG: hypothetical protein WDN30_09030 [Pararobbsia sp.]
MHPPQGVSSAQSERLHAMCANAAEGSNGANFDTYANCMQRWGYTVQAVDAQGTPLQDWQRPHPYWVNLYPLTFTAASNPPSIDFPPAGAAAEQTSPSQPPAPPPYQPPPTAFQPASSPFPLSSTTHPPTLSPYRSPPVAYKAPPQEPSAAVPEPPALAANPQAPPPISPAVKAPHGVPSAPPSNEADVVKGGAGNVSVAYPNALRNFPAGARLWQILQDHQTLVLRVAHPTGRIEESSLDLPLKTREGGVIADHIHWRDLMGRKFETTLSLVFHSSNAYSIETLQINVNEEGNPLPAAFQGSDAGKKAVLRALRAWLKEEKETTTITATALDYALEALGNAVTVKDAFTSALQYMANNTSAP